MKTVPTIDEPAWQRAIKNLCEELGWKAQVRSMEQHTIIVCPLSTDDHFTGVLFVISSVTNRLVIYVSYRVKASLDRYGAMSEAIARINFGLLGGCLEMDSKQGEVRYRDGLLLVTSEVDIELLRALVATTLRDALSFHVALESVASGQSPEQAVSAIEED